MRDKIAAQAFKALFPLLMGALGSWLMIQFPAVYKSLCSAGLL